VEYFPNLHHFRRDNERIAGDRAPCQPQALRTVGFFISFDEAGVMKFES
jgi:hypothetical protein